MTLASVATIMSYATCTKNDFTVLAPALYQAGMVFAVAGIFIAIFAPKLHFFFACIGVVFFGFYLLFDTQLIISGTYGGHKRFQIDEDSYIMANVILYLDIINMFLYILEILNSS